MEESAATPKRIRSNQFPQASSAFIGREQELAELRERLADPECRLLTIVGPGGIGKTRMATELVATQVGNFADGVFFVNLQSLKQPELLPAAIADALGLSLSGPEEPGVQLLRQLENKESLLLLDNFEQLANAAGFLAELLQQAPAVKLLVTSREALQLQEEWLYPVKGLSFPASDETEALLSYPAVKLFVQLAQRVRPDFSLDDEQAGVVRICQLVEGMPLALELATSWLSTLRCSAIAAEIQRNLNFLASTRRNAPDRHRSIQAVFNHSWKLLAPAERRVCRRLSVFRGGFTREAAEAVAGADLATLASLLSKSWLRREPDGRYQVHELLRQYAAEKLAEEPEAVVRARERHGHYYAAFLEQRLVAMNSAGQRRASAEIANELDNVLAAWQWAVTTVNVPAIRQSASTFFFFCQMQSRFLEGANALAEAATALQQLPSSKRRDVTLANLCNHEGWLRVRVGDFARAETLHAQSRRLLARHNEPPPPYMGSDSAVGLGIIASIKGDHKRAITLGEKARQAAAARDDILNLSFAHYLLTTARAALGEYESAYRHAEQACSLALDAGSRWFLAYPLNEWGKVARAMDKVDEAKMHFQASYSLKKEFDDPEGMAVALRHLGEIAIRQSDYAEAEKRFRESLTIYRHLNDQAGLAASLKGLGQVAYGREAYEKARENLEKALTIATEIEFLPLVFPLLVAGGKLLLRIGEPAYGITLLTLVQHHAASQHATKERAARQLRRCREEVDDGLFSEAVARGKKLDLEVAVTTLQTILATPLPAEKPIPSRKRLLEPLTDREREVLGLMAQGYTNSEIAEALVIAVGTVKWYASQIYGKLDVSNRTEAAARARELGLLS